MADTETTFAGSLNSPVRVLKASARRVSKAACALSVCPTQNVSPGVTSKFGSTDRSVGGFRSVAHYTLPEPRGTEVTTMQNPKQEALEAIQRLPDDTDTEEIIYRLYVLENIRRGQEDAAEGRTEPVEAVLQDIQAW
jgi:hypothetical protein